MTGRADLSGRGPHGRFIPQRKIVGEWQRYATKSENHRVCAGCGLGTRNVGERGWWWRKEPGVYGYPVSRTLCALCYLEKVSREKTEAPADE